MHMGTHTQWKLHHTAIFSVIPWCGVRASSLADSHHASVTQGHIHRLAHSELQSDGVHEEIGRQKHIVRLVVPLAAVHAEPVQRHVHLLHHDGNAVCSLSLVEKVVVAGADLVHVVYAVDDVVGRALVAVVAYHQLNVLDIVSVGITVGGGGIAGGVGRWSTRNSHRHYSVLVLHVVVVSCSIQAFTSFSSS